MTSARAVRPVKARVVAVRSKRGSVSAARCVGDGPGLRAAEERGAHRGPGRAGVQHPARVRAVHQPAGRDEGQRRLSPYAGEQRGQRQSRGGRVVVGEATAMCAGLGCPAATARPTPTAAACEASATDVTVTSTAEPAACSRRTVSADGQPKARLTTGTPATAASLASTSSSSQRGSPGSTPSAAASGRSRSR